jgi:citrate synthase
VLLGTSEACARLLERALSSGEESLDCARRVHGAGEKMPGFGHPVHRDSDPRAERILALADERGVSGAHVTYSRALRPAVAEVWGRPLPMNVALPIAAVMLDLGFSADVVKAVPILARTAGLLAHLAEERLDPIGFELARAAEEAGERA